MTTWLRLCALGRATAVADALADACNITAEKYLGTSSRLQGSRGAFSLRDILSLPGESTSSYLTDPNP